MNALYPSLSIKSLGLEPKKMVLGRPAIAPMRAALHALFNDLLGLVVSTSQQERDFNTETTKEQTELRSWTFYYILLVTFPFHDD